MLVEQGEPPRRAACFRPQAVVLRIPQRAGAFPDGRAAQPLRDLLLQELVAAGVVRLPRFPRDRAARQRGEARQVTGSLLQVRPAQPVLAVVLRLPHPGAGRLDQPAALPAIDAGGSSAASPGRVARGTRLAREVYAGETADPGAARLRADRLPRLLFFPPDSAGAAVDSVHRRLPPGRARGRQLPPEPRAAGLALLAQRRPEFLRPARRQGVRVFPHLLAGALQRPGADALAMEGSGARLGHARHHPDPHRRRP